ncbi:cell shape determination protein CcmA [Bacillus sp. AFS015802]|uniref:polymer-forming cytoskeletal protein n=1 Tax=Bacillus sp. AFS015802 TaxID=2033486 RepID=UPI000BF4CDF4|nr:polymer-forming cytoskeletal protein [Bacillus sp. AFS015802]PFA63293.1 cell shape determination protein CcmA [Bacillus sp. AFS015802]
MNTVEKNKLHDLKISGSGTSGGGLFDEVKISGSGKIAGDVDCREMKISGSGTVAGNVKSGLIKTSGSSTIEGDTKAETITTSGSSKYDGSVMASEMNISGSSKVTRDLIVEKFKISGSCKIGGKIQGGSIKASGSLRVDQDCEVETFSSSGSVHIDGLLNADKVHIEINHESSIKEIGGEKISVTHHSSNGLIKQVVNFLLQKEDYLFSDLIEGDEVYLENTKAKLVRGKNVVIREHCVIDTVEYSGTLDVHKDSTILKKVKI